jgi:hypothetical protein
VRTSFSSHSPLIIDHHLLLLLPTNSSSSVRSTLNRSCHTSRPFHLGPLARICTPTNDVHPSCESHHTLVGSGAPSTLFLSLISAILSCSQVISVFSSISSRFQPSRIDSCPHRPLQPPVVRPLCRAYAAATSTRWKDMVSPSVLYLVNAGMLRRLLGIRPRY